MRHGILLLAAETVVVVLMLSVVLDAGICRGLYSIREMMSRVETGNSR